MTGVLSHLPLTVTRRIFLHDPSVLQINVQFWLSLPDTGIWHQFLFCVSIAIVASEVRPPGQVLVYWHEFLVMWTCNFPDMMKSDNGAAFIDKPSRNSLPVMASESYSSKRSIELLVVTRRYVTQQAPWIDLDLISITTEQQNNSACQIRTLWDTWFWFSQGWMERPDELL
jgi:hypothetical protein